MKTARFFKKATACLLAVLMLASVVVTSQFSVANAVNQTDVELSAGSYTLQVGDEVKIKSGAKDYEGKSLLDVYSFITFNVRAIDGDKVTLFAEYSFGSLSETVELVMNINDLIYDEPVEKDSDTDTEEVSYSIGVGSVVSINAGARDKDGKSINSAFRLLQYTVTSLNGSIAEIECKITLSKLQELGLTKEVVANALGYDADSLGFTAIWLAITGIGYTLEYSIDTRHLSLISGGVVSGTKSSGVYVTRDVLKTPAYYHNAETKRLELAASITIPKGKKIYARDGANGKKSAFVVLDANNAWSSGDLYWVREINLDGCDFVSEVPTLFDKTNYKVGTKVTLEGRSLASKKYFFSTESYDVALEDLFKSGIMSNGYCLETTDSDEYDEPYCNRLEYEITKLLGDVVQLRICDEFLYDGLGIELPEYLHQITVSPRFLEPVDGTYCVKETTLITERGQQNSTTGVYDKNNETIGRLIRNTLLYIEPSCTYENNGRVHVYCDNTYGYVDFEDLELVSTDKMYVNEFREGDMVKIKPTATDYYFNYGKIFDDPCMEPYFGSDYKEELYELEYEIRYIFNDYVTIAETHEKIAERKVNDQDTFVGWMNIKDLYKEGKPEDSDSDTETDTDEPKILYGDADMNGKVEMSDVTYMQRAIAELVSLTSKKKLRADVDGNGKINLTDVVLVQRYKAKLIDKFPAEKVVNVG